MLKNFIVHSIVHSNQAICVSTRIVYSKLDPQVLNPRVPDSWVLRSTEYTILEGGVDHCSKHADLEGSVGFIPPESGGIRSIKS